MNDSTQPAEVTFHSEASNYRVVRDPQRRRQIGESNESEVIPGKDYQFYDGIFVARDADDIDWLRDYESNGKLYWEVGSPEDRPENSAATQAVIIEKALAGDFDGIADILVAERSSLSRPEVISACTAALNAGEEDLPPVPDVPIHELQRVRMGPTAGVTPGISPDPVPGTPEVDPSTLTEPDGEPAQGDALPSAQETVPDSDVPVQEPPPGLRPLQPTPEEPPESEETEVEQPEEEPEVPAEDEPEESES